MDYIAIVQGKDVTEIKWCKDAKEAGDWFGKWLADNRATRPYVRCIIAKSIFVIEG